MPILCSLQQRTIRWSSAVAWITATKLQRRRASLSVGRVSAGSLEDRPGCNRGAVISGWVVTWVKGGGHYRGLAFRVSKEEEKGEVRESEKYYKHESEKKEILRFEWRAEKGGDLPERVAKEERRKIKGRDFLRLIEVLVLPTFSWGQRRSEGWKSLKGYGVKISCFFCFVFLVNVRLKPDYNGTGGTTSLELMKKQVAGIWPEFPLSHSG